MERLAQLDYIRFLYQSESIRFLPVGGCPAASCYIEFNGYLISHSRRAILAQSLTISLFIFYIAKFCICWRYCTFLKIFDGLTFSFLKIFHIQYCWQMINLVEFVISLTWGKICFLHMLSRGIFLFYFNLRKSKTLACYLQAKLCNSVSRKIHHNDKVNIIMMQFQWCSNQYSRGIIMGIIKRNFPNLWIIFVFPRLCKNITIRFLRQ